MKNELQQHKKSDSVKWILTLVAFLLVGVTLGGILLGVFTPKTTEKESVQQEQEASINNGGYVTDFINTEGISLFSVTPMTYSTTSGTASQEIYAAVRPATAVNKNITWSVAWKEEKAEDVSQYITVTPSSEENQATVTCYKPFEGDIVITATTEEGGFTAQCVVQFLGYPSGLSVETNAYFDGEKYLLGAGGDFTFNVAPYNAFNQLGEQYKNLEVIFSFYGTFTADTYNYNYSTQTWSWAGNEKTISLDSIKDKIMTPTYADGCITISTKQAVEDYYDQFEYMDGGRTRYYTDKFKEANSECYMLVTITQPESYFVKQLKVVVDNTRVANIDMMQTMIF